MTPEMQCTLCNSEAALAYELGRMNYYRCTNCLSIMLDPLNRLPSELEKRRYEEHNNDVDDPRYQKFVAPIVDGIKRMFGAEHTGLDFGSGPGPVITKLFRDEGFNIQPYDPFFADSPRLLDAKYDYIACCEVMEHFHSPKEEFERLRSLLKPKGILYCMTRIYSEDIDFRQWHYKNDQTHIFFYHKNALHWIQSHLNYSKLNIEGRLIQFQA